MKRGCAAKQRKCPNEPTHRNKYASLFASTLEKFLPVTVAGLSYPNSNPEINIVPSRFLLVLGHACFHFPLKSLNENFHKLSAGFQLLMQYREHYIEPLLRPFVKVVWSMESNAAIFDASPMRILPDTCVELVVHFSDPYKTTFSDNTVSTQEQSFIVTQMKSFMEIQPHGKTGFIAVRFSASGAYHFLGIPLKEVSNTETGLHHIWNNLATEIEERIYLAPDNDVRSRIIQQYLLLQLSTSGKTDKIINFCITEISSSKGQVSMEELSYKIGISNRQLIRRFNTCVGLSPKEFARITKFINTLNYLKQYPEKNLTQVGYACGYYDQAHFIRDFKEYSGLTPSEYLISENVVY